VPRGTSLINDKVTKIDPDKKMISLASGEMCAYDYLVVAAGLALDWDKVKGLKQALGKDGVCTNYSPEYVEYTNKCIKGLKKGDKILFTQPPMPFKCAGAPQKIAYLTADHLSKKGILQDCQLDFFNHGPGLFSVPYFAKRLAGIMDRYGIKRHLETNLIEIDAENKKAVFETLTDGKKVSFDYDMIHVTPPQGPQQFLKKAPVSDEGGWVEVDQNSLQHVKYKNIFALGDCCNVPTSKTAAAVRKQAPVVVKNLLAAIDDKKLPASYDGYTSCPLVTGYGKVMIAEFTYGPKVTPTLPLCPGKEHGFYWWVKKTALPMMYWHYMLKGREWFLAHNTGFKEDEPAAQPAQESKPEQKKAA
jgi:sulfide:quinone oxidoreductase